MFKAILDCHFEPYKIAKMKITIIPEIISATFC